MEGLERVIERLVNASLHVDVWVDGSFLTTKRDPNDADIVISVPVELYEGGDQRQKEALEWIKANQKGNHKCDSYIFFVFPDGDARAVYNDYNYAYWIRQFGFSRGEEIKGIAVLNTGGLS